MQQLYTDTAEPGPADGVAGCRGGDAAVAAVHLPARADGSTGRHDGHRAAGAVRAGDAAVVSADGSRARTTRCSPPSRPARWTPRTACWRRPIACWRARARRSCSCTSPSSGGSWATSPALDKDRALYRTWTDATPGALAEETRLFLTAAWQGTPNLTTLLTAPFTFVDADLASFYNLPAPGGSGFQRVDSRPHARGRPADAGVVPGRARQGRPDVARAARQVRARQAVLPTRRRRRRPTSS